MNKQASKQAQTIVKDENDAKRINGDKFVYTYN